MSSDSAVQGTSPEVASIGRVVEKEARIVVVKVLRVLERDQKELLRDETRVARGHPGILPFLGTSKVGGRTARVSLYMSNGNLMEYIKAGDGRDKKRLIVQVAEAVDYLHNGAGCVHGNIKCTNVLISDNGHALLSDFALSTVVNVHPSPDARDTRSLRFTAPELLGLAYSPSRRPSKTFETDIYAFGMLVLEVITGDPPWFGFSDSAVIQRVSSGEHPDRRSGGAFVTTSHSVWDLCCSCWRADPAGRPAIKTILGRLTDIILEPVKVIQHSSAAFSVAYAPGGRRIVSGSLGGSIQDMG